MEAANEALLRNLEHMNEKIHVEKSEVDIMNRRAFQRIADEVNTMREIAEGDLLQLNSAHSKAINELQVMIEDLISTRAAESSLARREADRLGKDLAQMLKENMECFQLLQELAPKSELESTRFGGCANTPRPFLTAALLLSGATCTNSRRARIKRRSKLAPSGRS